MTDETGIDIVPVHINGGGIEIDLWYAHCLKCGWSSERVAVEEAARKDKVAHIIKNRCLATSTGETPS